MKSQWSYAWRKLLSCWSVVVVLVGMSAPLAAQSGTPQPAPPPLTLSGPKNPPPPAPAAERLSEKLALKAPEEDITSLSLSAGGVLSAGNTNAYQALVGGDFKLVRRPSALSAAAAFAYGRAGVRDQENIERMVETVENLNARAKYEVFLSTRNALFVATGFRWDPFAGIARRNSGQIGYGRYFIAEAKHRFWAEVGYDLTGSRYRVTPTDPDMPPPKRSEVVHSGRLFVGYENQLNEAVTYIGGVEGLLNVERPRASRINWDNALRSTLSAQFKLELKFRLMYEAERAGENVKDLDTATTVSLLYSLI